MALEDHSRLIRDAARRTLSPLGFQQKGQSRLWFADRGLWALVVEFQPSGFSKGSYLNVCAMWLWSPSIHWVFNYYWRADRFIEFRTIEQFKPEAKWLADQAGLEAALLDKKFESIGAIASYLKRETEAEACDPQLRRSSWPLYHAAIAAGLAGDQEFSLRCFSEMMTGNWTREIQIEVASLAKLLAEDREFHSAILKKVAATRAALKLPPLPL